MSRFLRFALVFLMIAGPCMAQKKRVAVLNFEYGTVRSSTQAIFGTDQDVGKGISDMLVQKLVQDGKYSVIERNALDKVLGEQNFSNSDRADASTAAKIVGFWESTPSSSAASRSLVATISTPILAGEDTAGMDPSWDSVESVLRSPKRWWASLRVW